jgi:hypothetical protein
MENNLETKAQEISNNFKEFLGIHNKFIGYGVSYKDGEFIIKIKPIKEGDNSQRYFIYHFESEKGQEKLAKFAKENNVGFVEY